MAAAPSPVPVAPEPGQSLPTWGAVFKDKAMIISLVVMFQFYTLIILFSQRLGGAGSGMDPQAKMIILQTYVVAFSVSIGFWLKDTRDALLGRRAEQAPNANPTTPPTDSGSTTAVKPPV